MKLPNISLDKYLKTHKTLILFSVFLIVVFGEFFLSIYEHLPFTFNDILKYTYGYFIYALITKMEVLSEKIDNLGDVNDLRTRVTALEKQNKLLATVIIANKENLNGLSDIIKAVIQEHLNEMLTNMENLNGLSDIIKNFIQEHYLNELKSDIPDATAL